MQYEWNWRVVWLSKEIFVEGALLTLQLSIAAIVLGTAFGFLLALLRNSRNPIFSVPAKIYVEILRAFPVLILLIWIYYVVPILFGWQLSALVAAVLTLTMNLAAYVAEAVRAGLESIPRGQFESGYALGLSQQQVMRRIVVPQAVRNMIPNLMGLYATEIKNSSFASVIGVNELLHKSNILTSETFRPLEIYTTVAFVYLAIILPIILLSRRLEKSFLSADKPTFGMEYEFSH